MNRIRNALAAACLIAMFSASADQLEWALQSTDRLQETAESAYASEDYKLARKTYFKLASIGDKYSQYRLSKMYLEGKGTKRDSVRAYAWAKVAAENGRKNIIQYADSIWNSLSETEKTEALTEAEKFYKRYNNFAVIETLYLKARREKLKSIGHGLLPDSLVGISAPCDDPSFNAISGQGEVVAASTTSNAGSPCAAPGTNSQHPGIRLAKLKALEQVMGGLRDGYYVELGEFEVLEEEVKPASKDSEQE